MNSVTLANNLLKKETQLELEKYLEHVWNQVWSDKKAVNYSKLRLFKTIDKINTISLMDVDFRNKKVLDIGCGNGTTLIYLQKYFNIYGQGIDVSPAVINTLKKNILNKRLNFSLGDHRNLKKIKNNQFDIVLSFGVIEHFDEYGLALTEARRVLKNDGLLILIQPHLFSFGVVQEFYLRLIKKWKFGKQKDFSYLYYKSILKQAGFKNIKHLTKLPYKDMYVTRMFDSVIKSFCSNWGHYLYLIAQK